jgi:hypothetical protein
MGHPAFAAGMGSGCESSRRDYLEFPMYRQQKLGAPFKPFFGLSGIHGTRPGEVDGHRQHNGNQPGLLARVLFNAFSKLLCSNEQSRRDG